MTHLRYGPRRPRTVLGSTVLGSTVLRSTVLGLFAALVLRPSGGIAGDDQNLLTGRDLSGWRVVEKNVFEKHGRVQWRDDAVVLGTGRPATGIVYEKEFPRSNYEVSLEAKRVEGHDFFCGMTFPVGDANCTLIVGGWGGTVTGLSNVDGDAAVDNETTNYVDVQQNQWYAIRLRVTDARVEAWVGERKIIDVATENRTFSIWWEQEPMRPFGIATWNTTAAIRKVVVRSANKRTSRQSSQHQRPENGAEIEDACSRSEQRP